MKHYIKTYYMILKINFAYSLTYRSTVFSDTFLTILWSIFNILTILFLTHNTTSAFGWDNNRLILLSISFNIAMGIFHSFFTANFINLTSAVMLGELDSSLLKPIDTQFLISTKKIQYSGLSRIVVNLPLLLYFLTKIGISFTFVNIIVYLMLLLCGVLTLYGIWFIVLTITIWNPHLSNLINLLYQINNLSRYPPGLIQGLNFFLSFILLPISFVLVVPVKSITYSATNFDFFLLIFSTALILMISRVFWRFALRSYTSASS